MLINMVAIALFIIMAVIVAKYKLVCEVTVDGEQLGYVASKEGFEQSVSDIINKEEKNKLYTTLEKMPEYKVALVDRKEETKEEQILAKLKKDAKTTYKFYAVTVDGKKKATIKSLNEAEKMVKKLNKKYEKKLKTKIAVVEVITTNNKKNITTVKKANASITKTLNKKVAKIEAKKAKEAAKKAAAKAKAQGYTISTSSSGKVTKVASLNGVKFSYKPVSGIITSRFGSRESIRSRGHTGLDIAAPRGTTIKAASSGTVIFAGYSGGYGNLVKISHGNGIVTYYGHCSKLYVSKGQKVSAGSGIAAVGSTGHSTGNHLHFEVVKNGTKLNPQNYLY